MIDCYSVKPIDAAALRAAADDTGLLVVVEDHRIEGGLGDAVLDALAGSGDLAGRVIKLAVTELPGSGTPEELRAWARIDADAIVEGRPEKAPRPGPDSGWARGSKLRRELRRVRPADHRAPGR